MEERKSIKLGSISAGTWRMEDLLPAFTNVLERLDGSHELIQKADQFIDRWDEENVMEITWGEELVDKLQAAMNEFCPPFIYFGAHKDDPTDFGFWLDYAALEAAMKHNYVDEVRVNVCLHGNIGVSDLYTGEHIWVIV